tara:strand:- start:3869 stop:4402 length:534 start_codon:yes stop_codon:yes gene_type:complete
MSDNIDTLESCGYSREIAEGILTLMPQAEMYEVIMVLADMGGPTGPHRVKPEIIRRMLAAPAPAPAPGPGPGPVPRPGGVAPETPSWLGPWITAASSEVAKLALGQINSQLPAIFDIYMKGSEEAQIKELTTRVSAIEARLGIRRGSSNKKSPKRKRKKKTKKKKKVRKKKLSIIKK